MASKKNKKSAQQQPLMTPERLIVERGRTIPLYKCYVSQNNLKENGLGDVVIVRKFVSGKYAVGAYMVDAYCCGVKNTLYRAPIDEDELKECFEMMPSLDEVPYEVAHNWIYGSIAWAEEAGIKPHKHFAVSQYLLEEDTDDIPLIDYEFGCEGKHFLMCKTNLEAGPYLSAMKKNLSEDEYEVYIDDDSDEDSYLPKPKSIDDVEYSYQGGSYLSELKVENPKFLNIVSKNSKQITQEDLDEIASMPQDSISRDMHNILYYEMGRSWGKNYLDIDDDSDWVALCNVLTLMAEYGNPNSNLEDLLEVLRQNDGFYEFYIGDCSGHVIVPTLYKLAKDNLNILKSYLLEPGLYTFFKVDAIVALKVIGREDPSKRSDVLRIADELMDVYIETIEARVVSDGTLAAFLTGVFIDLNAKEYLPKIKKLYATGLVDEDFCGSIADVEKIIMEEPYNEPFEFDLKKRLEWLGFDEDEQ